MMGIVEKAGKKKKKKLPAFMLSLSLSLSSEHLLITKAAALKVKKQSIFLSRLRYYSSTLLLTYHSRGLLHSLSLSSIYSLSLWLSFDTVLCFGEWRTRPKVLSVFLLLRLKGKKVRAWRQPFFLSSKESLFSNQEKINFSIICLLYIISET